MPATVFERVSKLLRLRWTIRLRLTLLYCALFIASEVALLGITYALVARGMPHLYVLGTQQPRNPLDGAADMTHARALAVRQHAADLRQLLTQSGVALGIMAAVSVVLGWLVAGRVSQPIRQMAAKARGISERNLHERLAMTGANDELKELGDTFDGLLGRLETAFDAQKRFVANASHELRTPLTLQRAMLEVALSDPQADVDSLRAVCKRVLAAGGELERLIEALLILASSQRGLDRREPMDIAVLVVEALQGVRFARIEGRRLETVLDPARASGAPRLFQRLVTNLLDNAVRHNIPGGWIHVSTGMEGGQSVLRVSNSGPIVPHHQVDALFQPFQRLRSRTDHHGGHGLGLSIVAAIASAHGADLHARALPGGGLDIEIRLGAASTDIF
jgi:signal transduction histidine kinase